MPVIEPLPESEVAPELLDQMNRLVESGQMGSGTTDWPRTVAETITTATGAGQWLHSLDMPGAVEPVLSWSRTPAQARS